MDYKYIEGLLERYFAAETSLEEESILRSFFSQEDIPADLEQWRALFTSEDVETLDDAFDDRMLAMIDEEPQTVKAREVTLTQRLRHCHLPDYWWCPASTMGPQLGHSARLCCHTAGC